MTKQRETQISLKLWIFKFGNETDDITEQLLSTTYLCLLWYWRDRISDTPSKRFKRRECDHRIRRNVVPGSLDFINRHTSLSMGRHSNSLPPFKIVLSLRVWDSYIISHLWTPILISLLRRTTTYKIGFPFILCTQIENYKVVEVTNRSSVTHGWKEYTSR